MNFKTQLILVPLAIFIMGMMSCCFGATEFEEKDYARTTDTKISNKGRPDIIYRKEFYLDGTTYITDKTDKTKMPKVGETCNFMHTLLQGKEGPNITATIKGETKPVRTQFDSTTVHFDLFERGCDDTSLPGEIKCDFVFDMQGKPIVLMDVDYDVTDYASLWDKDNKKYITVAKVKTKLYYKKCYCPYQTNTDPPLRLYYSQFSEDDMYQPTCTATPPPIPGLDNALNGKAVEGCH